MFGLTLGPDFEIFSQFLEMHLWITSSEKAKNGYEVMRIRCNFSLKIQYFIMFGLTLGPDFEIFSQFQEMRLWITFLHCNILRKSIKQFWGYAGQMQLFIKDSIFHNVWPNFGPRFWDIFSISGNALMNLFFSIAISSKKAKNGYEVMRIRCNFSLNIQFVIMFGLTLGPDFEIFSQFQEMCLWITFLHRNILRKSGKQFWSYADPMHLIIKDSIFHNVWPNLGPRFWDIFSISGNGLMNLFFSIVISCEKGKNGSEVLQVRCNFSLKIQFFMFGLTFGTRFWDIVSISGNVLMKQFFCIVISC